MASLAGVEPALPELTRATGRRPDAYGGRSPGSGASEPLYLATARTLDANPSPAAHSDRAGRYTLHIELEANSATDARTLAVMVTEAVGILCHEVETYTARLSVAGAWAHAEPIFCCAPGPNGDLCSDIVGHPGWHISAGIDGARWGDGDGRR